MKLAFKQRRNVNRVSERSSSDIHLPSFSFCLFPGHLFSSFFIFPPFPLRACPRLLFSPHTDGGCCPFLTCCTLGMAVIPEGVCVVSVPRSLCSQSVPLSPSALCRPLSWWPLAVVGGPLLSLYLQHRVTDPSMSKPRAYGRLFYLGVSQLLAFEVAGSRQ